MAMKTRNEMRTQVRNGRRNATEVDRACWSRAICNRLRHEPSFLQSQVIAGFLAFDGEADPLELMIAAVDLGKHVYVPTIVAKAQPLMFVPWSQGCEMAANRFGILEPIEPIANWIAAKELDYVITPLVAFDEACNRIGVGGGYYDRSFAHLKRATTIATSTQLMGFAFELQKMATIEVNNWDVRLDGVATESSIYRCLQSGD